MKLLHALALSASLAFALLGGCSDDSPAPPPPSEGSATVGAAGGQVSGPDGVVVNLPAGALAADTTVRIARDSSGAPALPDGLTALGSIYLVTPHIPFLAVPTTVSLPIDVSRVDSAGPAPEVLVAQPGGDWESLGAAAVVNGRITALTTHFSWVLVAQRPVRLTDVTVTVPQALPHYAPFGIIDPNWPAFTTDHPFSGTIRMAIVPTAFSTNNPSRLYCISPLTLSVVRLTTHADGSLHRVQTDFGPYTSPTAIEMPFSIDASDAAGTAFYLQESCHLTSSVRGGVILGGNPVSGAMVGFVVNIPPAPGAPVITSQPQSASVVAGQAASFAVTATAAGTLTTEWFRSNDGGSTWGSTGSSANPYTFSTTSGDDAAQFRAHLCDVIGAQQTCADSSAATLAVSAASAAPSFGTQPASVSVQAGQTASITVSASGTPPPRVRIFSGTAPGGALVLECAAPGSGSNTPCSYTTPALALGDSGSLFYAVADNTAGSVTSLSASVTVTSMATPPVISTQPAGAIAVVGGSASFSVSAGGTAPLSYQWFFKGAFGDVPLNDRAASGSGSGISGSASPTLAITNVQAADAGLYWVTVSNGLGAATSGDASLALTAGQPSTVGACLGDASGWCYIQPAPMADSLSGLAIDRSNGKVYAVGVTNGTVMQSSDQGNSWAVSWDAARYTWNDLAQPSSGVLVATGSVPNQAPGIFRSTDGGASWSAVYNLSFGDYLSGVSFADDRLGVAVGSKVWRTTDGGLTWSPVSISTSDLPSGTGLYRVAYAGNNVFVTIAAAGTFLRSSDGGLTWSRVTTAGTDFLVDLAFGSGGAGVAVQQSQPQVLRTSDYGATWSVVNVGLSSGANAVAFADPNTVVVMGSFSATIRSTDGGATWSDPEYSLNGGQQNWRLRFANAWLGLAVGAYGAVGRTLDGGQTWTRIAGGRLDDSIERLVTSQAGNVTLAGGLNGQIRRSTDAGATWTDIYTTALSGDAGLSFGNASTVMGFGLFGTVALSSDAGVTWTNVLNDPNANFNDGAMASATTAVVVGRTAGSAPGSGGFMRRTTDAGATWNPVSLPTSKWLWRVRFLTPLVGLAGGEDSSLLRTTDGGVTWTAINFQPYSPFDNVQGIERVSDTVVILSTDSELKRSTDGGQTWTRVHLSSGRGSMKSAAFRDSSTGIAVGVEGVLLTSDGGQTWTTLDLPIGTLLSAATWASPTTPLVGGDGGALLRNQRSGALSAARAKALAVRGAATTGPSLKTSR